MEKSPKYTRDVLTPLIQTLPEQYSPANSVGSACTNSMIKRNHVSTNHIILLENDKYSFTKRNSRSCEDFHPSSIGFLLENLDFIQVWPKFYGQRDETSYGVSN